MTENEMEEFVFITVMGVYQLYNILCSYKVEIIYSIHVYVAIRDINFLCFRIQLAPALDQQIQAVFYTVLFLFVVYHTRPKLEIDF